MFIRWEAAKLLGAVGGKKAAAALRDLTAKEEIGLVKAAARETLKKLEGKGS